MKRRGVNIPTTNSVSLSQILFLIATGKNYAQVISEERKIDSSATVKQLNILLKRGYLLRPRHEPLLNKKIYSVNWKRISFEFFQYLKHKKTLIDVKEKPISNYYFLRFLEGVFSSYGKIKKDIIIHELFNKLLLNGIPNKSEIESRDYTMEIRNDRATEPEELAEWKEFLEINKLIEKVRETDNDLSEFKDITQKAVDKIYEDYKNKRDYKNENP